MVAAVFVSFSIAVHDLVHDLVVVVVAAVVVDDYG